MNSNLMSTSSKKIYFKECILPIDHSPVKKFGFCDLWIHRIYRSHLLSIIWISSNKRLNISLLILYNSSNQRHIRFMNRSFCDLELESMHRTIIFRNDNQSTRILIESMNNTRTFHSIDNRRIEFWIFTSDAKSFKVIQQCIYERSHPSSFSWSWMCIDSCILINDRKIIIFIDNIEWHILCNKCHLIYLPLYLYNISSIDFFILSKIRSITGYFPLFYHLLEIAP